MNSSWNEKFSNLHSVALCQPLRIFKGSSRVRFSRTWKKRRDLAWLLLSHPSAVASMDCEVLLRTPWRVVGQGVCVREKTVQVDSAILGLAQGPQMAWVIRILQGIIFAQNNHSKIQTYTHNPQGLIILNSHSRRETVFLNLTKSAEIVLPQRERDQ